MPNGPSKQELEMYWQNSRQYFDELAAHYKKADPQYYKEYIEPFYTNPFAAASSGGQKTGGGKAAIVIVAVLVLMFGVVAAGGLLFYFGSQDSGTKEKEKYTKKVEEELKKEENILKEKEKESVNRDENLKKNEEPSSDDPSELSPEDNFIVGSKYITEKKYDKAEYHLKKIKKGDKYYEQAQQLLDNMNILRKYNK